MSLPPIPGSAAELVSKDGIEVLRGMPLRDTATGRLLYISDQSIDDVIRQYVEDGKDFRSTSTARVYGGLTHNAGEVEWIYLNSVIPEPAPSLTIDISNLTPYQIGLLKVFAGILKVQDALEKSGPVESAKGYLTSMEILLADVENMGQLAVAYAPRSLYSYPYVAKSIEDALKDIEAAAEPPAVNPPDDAEYDLGSEAHAGFGMTSSS